MGHSSLVSPSDSSSRRFETSSCRHRGSPMNKLITLGLGVATLGVAVSHHASAQANNNTTIPFVVVTLFTPGTVAVPMDLGVAAAVGTEMDRLLRDPNVISPLTGVVIPAEITRVALGMVSAATPEARE